MTDQPGTGPPASLSMTVLMTPDMSNFAGSVHGGALLKLLDQVAYACASRYAASYVVTLSVDRVLFREPIRVGELVTFLCLGQLHRPHVDGDRDTGRRPGHQNRPEPTCQQLLLHHGLRRRLREAPRDPPAGAVKRRRAQVVRSSPAAAKRLSTIGRG